MITWILILCSQLIIALSLLDKAEGGSLQKFQHFLLLESSTELSKYVNNMIHFDPSDNLVCGLAFALAPLSNEPVTGAGSLQEGGTES